MSSSNIGTLTSQNNYFGRAWTVTITSLDADGNPFGEAINISNSNWGSETLRVTFSTDSRYPSPAFYCELTIYNLNESTQQRTLQFGDLVTISAGYQKGFDAFNSVIYQGRVMQPMFEREGAINYIVRLRCMTGALELVQNFISVPVGPLATQLQIVKQMAQNAHNPNIKIENLDEDALSQTQLPRAKVLHGRPLDYIKQLAEATGCAAWATMDGLNVRSLQPTDNNQPAKWVYGPPYPNDITVHPSSAANYTPTLIGTPQQTDHGVSFSVLMDSRPKIGDIVELDISVIKTLPLYQGTLPSILDTGGRYIVIGIAHEGDTYGDPWNTRLDCVTLNFWQLYLAQGT